MKKTVIYHRLSTWLTNWQYVALHAMQCYWAGRATQSGLHWTWGVCGQWISTNAKWQWVGWDKGWSPPNLAAVHYPLLGDNSLNPKFPAACPDSKACLCIFSWCFSSNYTGSENHDGKLVNLLHFSFSSLPQQHSLIEDLPLLWKSYKQSQLLKDSLFSSPYHLNMQEY